MRHSAICLMVAVAAIASPKHIQAQAADTSPWMEQVAKAVSEGRCEEAKIIALLNDSPEFAERALKLCTPTKTTLPSSIPGNTGPIAEVQPSKRIGTEEPAPASGDQLFERRGANTVSAPAQSQESAKSDLVLNICRNSSLYKMFMSPEVFVNGKVVGKIKNDSNNSFSLKIGDEFRVGQKKNFFMGVYADDFAITATAKNTGEVFFVLRSRLNMSEVAIGSAFGQLGLMTANSLDENVSKIWIMDVVEPSSYRNTCNGGS